MARAGKPTHKGIRPQKGFEVFLIWAVLAVCLLALVMAVRHRACNASKKGTATSFILLSDRAPLQPCLTVLPRARSMTPESAGQCNKPNGAVPKTDKMSYPLAN